VRLQVVRDAYSAASERYIRLLDGVYTDEEADLVRRHLTGLSGPVLDLGCGPGYWTAFLHAHGADVTGVDVVPEFVAHARAAHPGPEYVLRSMTELDVAAGSVAGILSWYSTIHLAAPDLHEVLAGFRRLLAPSGVLVLGFFDSDDGAAPFDHAVVTAYRWPVDELARHLARAGLVEVDRLQHRRPERPDRRYAALVARHDSG
jgi:SAM-dependent methyltransferase